MGKTPRTDEYAGISEDFRGVEVVPADISRELEKRLAEAQAELADKDKQLAEARAEIERLNKNLRLLLCEEHFEKCERGLFNSENPDDEPCLICLMEAAERGE